jgi:hypothetical protein
MQESLYLVGTSLILGIDQQIWVVLPTHWLVLVGVKKSRSSGFEVLHGRKIQVYEREIKEVRCSLIGMPVIKPN